MQLRDFTRIDFILLLAAIALIMLGISFIFSSGITSEGELISNEYIKQIIWASIGLVIAMAVSMLNYKKIMDIALYLYLGVIVFLLLTFFLGRILQGSRWIRLGPISLQISEFAKISTILFLAWYLEVSSRNQNDLFRFIVSCAIVLLPMLLVLIQPDLGTALVFLPILIGMSFIAGISFRYLAFIGLSIIAGGIFLILPLWQTYIAQNMYPALMILSSRNFISIGCLTMLSIIIIAGFGYIRYKKGYFLWMCYGAAILILSLGGSYLAQKILKPYQIMRLIIFINPNIDPRGSGWQIIQSVTAIGSGGAFGKGYLQGTQSHYRYLPEQSTDFIFSILSEELGLAGGILVFALFLVILLRLIRIIKLTSDTFGSYIVAGILHMFAFHFIVNVGMTMGIMPITGIPLLFVSYGGSSLLASMIGIGLAMSVHSRRFLH